MGGLAHRRRGNDDRIVYRQANSIALDRETSSRVGDDHIIGILIPLGDGGEFQGGRCLPSDIPGKVLPLISQGTRACGHDAESHSRSRIDDLRQRLSNNFGRQASGAREVDQERGLIEVTAANVQSRSPGSRHRGSKGHSKGSRGTHSQRSAQRGQGRNDIISRACAVFCYDQVTQGRCAGIDDTERLHRTGIGGNDDAKINRCQTGIQVYSRRFLDRDFRHKRRGIDKNHAVRGRNEYSVHTCREHLGQRQRGDRYGTISNPCTASATKNRSPAHSPLVRGVHC